MACKGTALILTTDDSLRWVLTVTPPYDTTFAEWNDTVGNDQYNTDGDLHHAGYADIYCLPDVPNQHEGFCGIFVPSGTDIIAVLDALVTVYNLESLVIGVVNDTSNIVPMEKMYPCMAIKMSLLAMAACGMGNNPFDVKETVDRWKHSGYQSPAEPVLDPEPKPTGPYDAFWHADMFH